MRADVNIFIMYVYIVFVMTIVRKCNIPTCMTEKTSL